MQRLRAVIGLQHQRNNTVFNADATLSVSRRWNGECGSGNVSHFPFLTARMAACARWKKALNSVAGQLQPNGTRMRVDTHVNITQHGCRCEDVNISKIRQPGHPGKRSPPAAGCLLPLRGSTGSIQVACCRSAQRNCICQPFSLSNARHEAIVQPCRIQGVPASMEHLACPSKHVFLGDIMSRSFPFLFPCPSLPKTKCETRGAVLASLCSGPRHLLFQGHLPPHSCSRPAIPTAVHLRSSVSCLSVRLSVCTAQATGTLTRHLCPPRVSACM